MKLAICTLLDDNHSEMALTMLYSLVKHNPSLEFEFIVFQWQQLSFATIEMLNKIHSVKLVNVLTHDYEDCLLPLKQWRVWNYNPFYRFDIFKLSDYDKIIYLDADILVLKDLSTFVNLPHDFYASEMVRGTGMEFHGQDVPRFNAGVMGIGKKFLTNDVRTDLIRMTELQPWSGNQTPLNLYFQGVVTFVDISYNLQTNQFSPSNLNLAHILHFIGNVKPIDNLQIMSLAYEETFLKTSRLGCLYSAWIMFKQYHQEMRHYVD